MGIITIEIATETNQAPNQSGWLLISDDENSVYTFTLANFTTETTPAYEDPEGDILEAIKVVSLPTVGVLKLSGVPIIANDMITAAQLSGSLFTYTSIVSVEGYTDGDMEFLVSDIGSSTFTTSPFIVTIEIIGSENEPPSQVGDGNIDIDLGSITVFTRAMLTSDLNPVYLDPESDAADKLKVLSVPENGELQLNGVLVVANQIINFTDIDSGFFRYVNQDLDDGLDGFDFQISDVGSQEFKG